MKKDVQRGLDYTPLYRFLLSNVGQDWDKIHSEAVSRLDKEETIYDIVAQHNDMQPIANIGEASRYSRLYVDENNLLQIINPNIHNEQLYPSCSCCTHTFNGKVLVNTYDAFNRLTESDRMKSIRL